MAKELVSAFHATNNEKLVEFVHSYYVNNLNSPEFCSALQLRLNPTNNDQSVGRWRRSVLVKRETALQKRKEIIDQMILVVQRIMIDLDSIINAARGLEVEIKSLSEAVDDGEKVAAMENCFEELLQNDEKYNSAINRARESVLQSIVVVGNKGTEHYFL
ncbi:uncharacterized protein LOC125202859 [Salvia hispanica]|uniref:uncharacterized protein LOC125202859 n=1 Tax=Salvia hispanica TaxID=49212 RepID=UPI0020094F81|nr:uncharacterized protein LOC125202859 [Salvia hispanica]